MGYAGLTYTAGGGAQAGKGVASKPAKTVGNSYNSGGGMTQAGPSMSQAGPSMSGAGPAGGGISYGGGGGLNVNSLMSAFSNAAAPAPVQATGPIQNNVQTDPNMSAFMNSITGRIGALQAKEGQGDPNLQTQVDRLGNRLSSDTRQRAQDFAAQDINARARASQQALTENLARRGIRGDSGVAAGEATKIAENAQRETARSAAGIGLGDEQRLDALTLGGQGIMAAPGQYNLQQQAQTNSLYPQQLGGATAVGNQNLGQQGLNLNQWQAANNFNLAAAGNQQAAQDAKLSQLLAFTKLGQSGGGMYL